MFLAFEHVRNEHGNKRSVKTPTQLPSVSLFGRYQTRDAHVTIHTWWLSQVLQHRGHAGCSSEGICRVVTRLKTCPHTLVSVLRMMMTSAFVFVYFLTVKINKQILHLSTRRAVSQRWDETTRSRSLVDTLVDTTAYWLGRS